MLADDSGWQIKVLGLNGIVGQMTRHRWLSAHGHSLCLPQKYYPAPYPPTLHLFLSLSPEKPSIRLRGSTISSSVAEPCWSPPLCKRILSLSCGSMRGF